MRAFLKESLNTTLLPVWQPDLPLLTTTELVIPMSDREANAYPATRLASVLLTASSFPLVSLRISGGNAKRQKAERLVTMSYERWTTTPAFAPADVNLAVLGVPICQYYPCFRSVSSGRI